MGNTTIIELNHDRWLEIDNRPEEFVQAVLEQLRAGKVSELPGGRVVAFFPRWQQPIDKAWERWKSRWAKPSDLKSSGLEGK